MRTFPVTPAAVCAWMLAAVMCVGRLTALGSGNIDANNKFAWSENAGWFNFNPTNGGVTVVVERPQWLSGYAWAENIGWVKLGNAAGGPYANTATNTWGVNIISGKLTGYAWSETCGWMRFDPTNASVTLDWPTGTFDGYAWAENLGWIHFRNGSPAYSVQTTARLPTGTSLLIR